MSQHRYLMIKRQLQTETEGKLRAAGSHSAAGIYNNNYAPSFNIGASKTPGTSLTRGALSMHQYKLVSDWDSSDTQYDTGCSNHHDQQQRSPPRTLTSYQPCWRITNASATPTVADSKESHIRRSDLQKLLTSIRLTPQVPTNPGKVPALCDTFQFPQSSLTSLSSDNDSLSDSQLVDITHDSTSGVAKECSLQCLQMTPLSDSSAVDLTLTGRQLFQGSPPDAISRSALYNEYLQECLHGIQTRRNRTKSAPGGSRSAAPNYKQGTTQETCSPIKITYLSSDTQTSNSRDNNKFSSCRRTPRNHGVGEKTRGMLNKPPSLFYSDPVPRSRWYEMKTPEFHLQAKRNNDFVRKVCNW